MRKVIKIPEAVYLEAINQGFESRIKTGFAKCKKEAT